MDRRRQSLMALALERDLRTHLRINLLPRCDAMDEYYCVALLCVEIETKILTKKELFKNQTVLCDTKPHDIFEPSFYLCFNNTFFSIFSQNRLVFEPSSKPSIVFEPTISGDKKRGRQKKSVTQQKRKQ